MFLPMVAILWLCVIVMGIWMYRQEHTLKTKNVRDQVGLVTARILNAYENDDNVDAFFSYVQDYFTKHPLFDDIRITTYYRGKIDKYIGEPITPDDTRSFKSGTVKLTEAEVDEMQYRTNAERRRTNFYYEKTPSADRKLVIYTMLPFDPKLTEATSATNDIFVIVILIAMGGTVLAWMMSRRLGKNIRTLHDFAERASYDPSFVPNVQFPNDELGDISRHIVTFYNQRNAAIIKLKREHNVAYHALEEKSRMKRELTNNINHELKTPISVIKGYVDTILEHPEMDESSRTHFLNKVSDHIDRLTQLLNDLSKITRLEEGTQMINTEPVNLHEIVFQAASDFETSGVLGNMEFNYDIPPFCRVIGNSTLLIAVIANLTKNAVAYSKGTECNLILTDKDDQFFHFAFYDNGVGVKPESIPHLFDRFFREDNGRSRKKGGTGLGLSIVQSTIEALGGMISADNRSGGGLIFRFTLRRADNS